MEDLEQVEDPSPTPAELMIEPEQFDRHRDELNECFRVLMLWLGNTRTPSGIVARQFVLNGALGLGEPMTAKQIADLAGCSKVYVHALSKEVEESFGIVHPSKRTKGRG